MQGRLGKHLSDPITVYYPILVHYLFSSSHSANNQSFHLLIHTALYTSPLTHHRIQPSHHPALTRLAIHQLASPPHPAPGNAPEPETQETATSLTNSRRCSKFSSSTLTRPPLPLSSSPLAGADWGGGGIGSRLLLPPPLVR